MQLLLPREQLEFLVDIVKAHDSLVDQLNEPRPLYLSRALDFAGVLERGMASQTCSSFQVLYEPCQSQSVETLLSKTQELLELGVISYGHRSQEVLSSCSHLYSSFKYARLAQVEGAVQA